MSTFEKNISSFSIFIFILRIFGLVRLKENETVAEKILSRTHPLTFVLIFFSFFLMDGPQLNDDKITIFCQYVDRTASAIIMELMLLDAIIYERPYAGMLKVLSEIDELITRNLKIKINYKKCKLINILMASLSLIVFSMFQARFFMVTGVHKIFFILFSIIVTLSTFVELFFIAIVIQIYFRMQLIERFMIDEKISHQQLQFLNKLFSKIVELISIVNDIFGVSLLLIGGKK